MVDDNLQVAPRQDCDLSLDRPEPADPLITPATDASNSHSLSDGICRPSGSPSRPPNSYSSDKSKFYTSSYLDNDKKTAIALDRKINFNNTLSNQEQKNAKNGSINGSTIEMSYHADRDSLPSTSRSARLSLSNRQSSRSSCADRSSCSAINEIENENINDAIEYADGDPATNGSPAIYHQNGGDRASYAEIMVPISKYADRNILDADSSDVEDDIAPSENGSGTSPRATDTGALENGKNFLNYILLESNCFVV